MIDTIRRTPRKVIRSIRQDDRDAVGTWLLIAPLLTGVTVAEMLLFTGRTWSSIWVHLGTLLLCVVLLTREVDTAVVQVFALVPLFRLVNLGMPIFFELTALWFPLIYGPLIPAVVYVDRILPELSVPFGVRKGLLLSPLTLPLGLFLAEIEQEIIQSGPLIPTWSIGQLVMISVVMIGFVGFVEEYLFRGLLQETLEARLGRWPGLLLASSVFGLMHSGYNIPAEMLFAGSIGLIFGLVYDYFDSLVLVTILHGVLNIFLFAVLPIHGSFLF